MPSRALAPAGKARPRLRDHGNSCRGALRPSALDGGEAGGRNRRPVPAPEPAA
jgi:hypothetical protein